MRSGALGLLLLTFRDSRTKKKKHPDAIYPGDFVRNFSRLLNHPDFCMKVLLSFFIEPLVEPAAE